MHKRFTLSTTLSILSLLALFGVSHSIAKETSPNQPNIKYAKVLSGWIEKVTIKDQNIITKAKLDTGAKTSSLHAENIKLFKRNGKRWVRFDLVVEQLNDKIVRIPLERRRIRRVKIKDNDGLHDRRVVVELDICFDGRHYRPEFTLANREDYIYDILLGREFLKKVAVVDSAKTFQTRNGCPDS